MVIFLNREKRQAYHRLSFSFYLDCLLIIFSLRIKIFKFIVQYPVEFLYGAGGVFIYAPGKERNYRQHGHGLHILVRHLEADR